MCPWRLAGLLLLSGIGGCGSVVTSTPLTMTSSGPARSVEGSKLLGAYCLTQSILEITIQDDDQGNPQMSIVTNHIPDSSHYFRVDYNASIFADDDVKLDLQNGCSLSGLTAKVQDESASILRQIANLAIQLATGLPTPSIPVTAGGQHAAVKRKFVGHLNIGLVNGPASEQEFNAELHRIYPTLDVHAGLLGSTSPPADAAVANTAEDGLYYQVPVPYVLTVTQDHDNAKIVQTQFVAVENGGPIVRVPVDRGAFISRNTTLSFSNGSLTSHEVVKPSEALQFVSLPVDVAKALLSIPAELLTARINVTQSQGNLLTQQESLLEDKIKLMTEQATYAASVKGATTTPPPTTPPASPPDGANQGQTLTSPPG